MIINQINNTFNTVFSNKIFKNVPFNSRKKNTYLNKDANCEKTSRFSQIVQLIVQIQYKCITIVLPITVTTKLYNTMSKLKFI